MRIRPTESTQILLVPIKDAEQNKRFLTKEEQLELDNKNSQQRRNEWSTWRRTVREELGLNTSIWYDEVGAPHVKTKNGEEIHVSVSHSSSHVAIMFSKTHCGLDIEHCERNFERIKNKYLSSEEEQLASEERTKAVIWCAKEAIYKYAGCRKLDLRRDIVIIAADWKQKQLTAELRGTQLPSLHFIEFEDQIICWLTE